MFGHGLHEDGDAEADSGDEARIGARLSYLMMLMRHSAVKQRRGGGRQVVAHSQGRVLGLLAESSPASQKELAYLLGIRSQSLAELVSKLVAAGFVERQPDPNDRRSSLVSLTEAGEAAAASVAEKPVTDPFAVLTDAERQQLASLLDTVIEGMEAKLEGPLDPRMVVFKQLALSDEQPPGALSRFGPGGFGRGFGSGGFGPAGGPVRGFGRHDPRS